MSLFGNFAMTVVASTLTWTEFLAEQTINQQNKAQTHNNSSHNNNTPHSDNSMGRHSDTSHRNTYSHNNYSRHSKTHNKSGQHYNGKSEPHANSHSNYSGVHTNNGVKNHMNDHYDRPGTTGYNRHANSAGESGHLDRVVESTSHTDNPKGNHSDTGGYSQYSHRNTSGSHTNISAHNNFVPITPAFHNIVDNQTIPTGTVQIGLYSYDANKMGIGSTGADSKTVYYEMKVRKIKNIDGTDNPSAWKKILTNGKENAEGAYLYSFNSANPLGIANLQPYQAEGYYEIEALSYNIINGVRQESISSQKKTVIIFYDRTSVIEVTNSNKFINFTFGYNGVLSSTNEYQTYENYWSEMPTSKQKGLNLNLSVREPNLPGSTVPGVIKEQWIKGNIYITNTSGTRVSNFFPIVWNGSDDKISNLDDVKNGSAFIPEANITGLGEVKNFIIAVELQEYHDMACTIPGLKITQKQVSPTDATQLKMHIDALSPNKVTIAPTPSMQPSSSTIISGNRTVTQPSVSDQWYNKTAQFSLAFEDGVAANASGVKQIQYKVTTTTNTPTEWNVVNSNSVSSINIPNSGTYYVHYKAIDGTKNELRGYLVYKIDKDAPGHTEPTIDGPDFKFTVIDNLSGVKSIKMPNGVVNNYTGQKEVDIAYPIDFEETNYNFVFTDMAGNSVNYNYELIMVSLQSAKITNIIRAPENYSYPISLPTIEPVDIKAGYNITLQIETFGTDQITLYFKNNNQGVPVRTSTGVTTNKIVKSTTGKGKTLTDFTFWIDESVPLSTVIDVEIECYATMGSLELEETDTETAKQVFKIVGSAERDASVNQKH